MQQQVRTHSRTGWQVAETDRLFSAVKEAQGTGAPLRSVFESLSTDLGRKPNSIRNYYYACLKERPDEAPRSPAFTVFTPEETHELLRQVLIARGQGLSVRSCVMRMAEGSHSRMLRYQNKYRAILKHRPEMIAQVAQELRSEGLPCPAPAAMDSADAAFCDPENDASARLMAQPCVSQLLVGLKELLRRASLAETAQTLQRDLDRLKVEQDLRRLAWEKDYQEALTQVRELAACMRSLLEAELPQTQRCAAEDALLKADALLHAQEVSA